MPDLRAGSDHLLRGPSDGPAAGSGGEERGALARACAIRFPDLRELQGRERVEALIDHITETAIARGELEELRLAAYVQLRDAEGELSRITTGVTKSAAAINEAKRSIRPDLAVRVDDARWTINRCTEQINRMGGSEYDAASRAYTLLSGS